jgi:MFS family permease
MSTVATTAESAPARSFREVWLITAGHVMTHWYPATFYLLLPLIGSELGLSYSQIGSILTVQYVAGAISNVPGGLIVDAVGRKGLLMALSLFWVGVPYLIMGVTHTYWLMLVCSVLIGIGNNIWHPTAIPLLAHRYPERRGLVVSYHGMGGNVGDAVAPLVAGAMLAVLSWREVMIVNVIPGLVMSAVLLIMLGRVYDGDVDKASGASDGDRLKGSDTLAAMRALLANRTVVMLSLGAACRTLTQMALLTFLPIFLAHDLGYSAYWVGACLFLLQTAGFIASPIAGHLSDRMGRRRIIMSSMAMTGVILVFMAVAGRTPAFVFFIAFLGFFLFAIRAVLQAWVLDATPKNMAGTAIGIMFGAQAIGAAIGPLVAGVIADHYGIMAAFYFLAASIVVANLFVFFTPAHEMARKPAAV